MNSCLFCKIIGKEIPSTPIYEDENCYAFNDINPQAPIHILIVPKKHIDKIENLKQEEAPLIGELILVAKKIAQEKNLTKGYRLVFNDGVEGQQSVDHIHLHLLGGKQMKWPPC